MSGLALYVIQLLVQSSRHNWKRCSFRCALNLYNLFFIRISIAKQIMLLYIALSTATLCILDYFLSYLTILYRLQSILFSEFMKIFVTYFSSLWIKPTDTLKYNFIGITTLHVSGRPSAHHQDRMLPGVGRNCPSSILLLVAYGYQNCIKCTKADVLLRTPDDGQKGFPKHVES